MIPEYIAFTILEKVKNHHEKPPTAKLIFTEISDFKLADITFRYFLENLVNVGLLKLIGENKDDWGDLYILPKGEQFVNDYVELPIYQRNEDLGRFLNSLLIKDTGDLIQAKRSAQIHLDNQKRIYDLQRTLAEQGKRNIIDFQIREVNLAEISLKRIEDELEKRKILSMETQIEIGTKRETISIKYSKFDFTKQKLEIQLLEIAKSNGHTSMMPYLNELLEKIKTFNDFDFECDFFLNIHSICEEHAKEFWSKGHREEITKFFGNARILTDVFQHTWDYYNNPKPDIEIKKTDNKKKPQVDEQEIIEVKFDYSNKENYFLPDKLEAFKEIESELVKRKFIDNTGKWIESKNKLCAFIHLIHIKYLRKTLPQKRTWASLLSYRRYFENRYKIDIRKAFQKNQFPIVTAKDYIPDYKFIIPSEDL